jgi:Stress responsive A/B Barrel Domain
MIRHVAVFKFKPTLTPEARQRWMGELTELPGKIDFLRSISVGDDQLHGQRSWDAAVVADLDGTVADVPAYLNHPAHQAIGALSAPHLEQLVLVDFEL